MDVIQDFLKSSTIHGINYIGSSRNLGKIFWIFVVICGFSVAGYLINKSFDAWAQSPITTTIETLPISGVTLPNVTVCPPKNTYTNLNYDLMMAENMTLDNETRFELFDFAMGQFQNHFFKQVMTNMSKITETNQFYNWYYGYSYFQPPYWRKERNYMYFNLDTSAANGTFSTKYFGEAFDKNKVEKAIRCYFTFHPSVMQNSTAKLNIDIEKLTMDDLSAGFDQLKPYKSLTRKTFSLNSNHVNKNVTPDYYEFQFLRSVSTESLKSLKMEMMPGFKMSWSYLDDVEPQKIESDDEVTLTLTKAFRRKVFLIFYND